MSKSTLSVEVDLTTAIIAKAFCDMDDEQQAQFFVEVAKIMRGWDPVGRSMQVHLLAKHLADCACSSEDARDLVRDLGRELR